MSTSALPRAATPGFIAAFSLASSASAAAILFSVGTTKIIAMIGGPEAMAVMGLYRNLGAFLSVAIALGFGTFIVQKVSAARTSQQLGQIAWAAIILLCIQSLLMVVVAVAAAPAIAEWMFGGMPSAEQVRDTRVVVVAAFINLALQLSRNVLNRSEHLKALSIIQIATAASSLALIYPLMKFGSLGLAVNVASGGVLGLGLSVMYLWGAYEAPLRLTRPASGAEFLSGAFGPSLPFVLQAIISFGCLLTIQSLVYRGYGLRELGMVNAAILITDTLGMVIVAPVKSFFLPEFSGLSDETTQRIFFARMLGTLLCFGILASIGVLLGSRLAVTLLFSSDFSEASSLAAICGLSMMGQTLCWSFHLILLNKISNRLIVALDAAWSIGVLGLAASAISFELPIAAIAWTYAVGYTLYGVVYAITITRLYGRQWLSVENLRLLALGGLSVVACYGLYQASLLASTLACLAVAAVTIRHLFTILSDQSVS